MVRLSKTHNLILSLSKDEGRAIPVQRMPCEALATLRSERRRRLGLARDERGELGQRHRDALDVV